MTGHATLAGRADWLGDETLQRLLAILSTGGEEARVAGGAVRNALLGYPISDIDIATTTLPAETAKRASAAGFKAVPTGVEHGTITVVANGRAFEVTTLRADLETDGRHARVAFGRDWQTDAERRDFTMNGLYVAADGTIIDLVGGVADIENRAVRFIGDPAARIREDALRVLRFFRFFAWYGAGRPDAAGLMACARHKDGIDGLSAERVWSELKKLLGAPEPSRALLWMRQASVLSRVLPESEKWGIDAIPGLMTTERDLSLPADPLLRLQAIVPPDADRIVPLAERLRLSRVEASRMTDWAETKPIPTDIEPAAFQTMLYRGRPSGIRDKLILGLAAARQRAITDTPALVEAGSLAKLLLAAQSWSSPSMPVKGADLRGLGIAEGVGVGRVLRRLEEDWIDSQFTLDRDALLARAKTLLSDSH